MPVRECIPNWPLEWVSARGRYDGKITSLVLIHYAGVYVRTDKLQKSLLLTAKDRRRRIWSAALTIDDGPLLAAFEKALSHHINAKLEEIGAASLEIALRKEPAVPAADERAWPLASVSVLADHRRRRSTDSSDCA